MTVKQAAYIVAYAVSLTPWEYLTNKLLRFNYQEAYKILYAKNKTKRLKLNRKFNGLDFQDEGYAESQHLLEQLGLHK